MKNTGIKKFDYYINFVDNCYYVTNLPFKRGFVNVSKSVNYILMKNM